MAIADGNRFGTVRSSPASAALAAAGRGAGDSRHPLQLLLTSWPGSAACRSGDCGRCSFASECCPGVALPNLYYRKTREFKMVRDEEGFKRMFEMMGHLKIDMVMRDTQAMLDFIDRQPQAKRTALGTVGYCMSGPFSFAAAAHFPDRVKCAASIYGVNLATENPDSPHRGAEKARGELYFACAETDKYAPKEMVDKLEAHLKSIPGLRARVEWYPGAEHGFAFPLRQGIYHKPSAERHWERLFGLFRRNLQQQPS